MGNTQPVAMKHYLQVTDEHFKKALQNPVQSPAVLSGMDSHGDQPSNHEFDLTHEHADMCEAVHSSGMTPAGLEPASPG